MRMEKRRCQQLTEPGKFLKALHIRSISLSHFMFQNCKVVRSNKLGMTEAYVYVRDSQQIVKNNTPLF